MKRASGFANEGKVLSYENLTIILPTLNEAGNIKLLIERLQGVLPGAQVLVVDDNSSDRTPDIVQEMAKEFSWIGLIERSSRPCLTESIKQGIEEAGTYYVAWMDADFSHPPEVLKKLYETATVYGCCIATRFAADMASGQNKTENASDSFFSSALSTLLNFGVHKMLNLKITDYTSGFIVCRKELLAHHRFVGDYGEYFIELMFFLHQSGVDVKEIPFESPPRAWGESKTGATALKLFKRGIKYLWMVMRLFLKKTFSRRSLS